MKNLIKKKISNLLKEQRFAVIATQDKNEPYTNLVTFLSSKNLEKIYFPTSKKSKKYENLSANSRISILIDNRINEPKDIENAIALTAIGTSRQTRDEDTIKEFLIKHPYLKDFISSKECAMIEIEIKKYILVDNFQNVNILKF
jgi:general stress protein 26